MKVFIAGIMQGSRLDSLIADQDYRRQIAEVVVRRFPEAEIVDPNEIHPDGVRYGDEQAKATLLAMADLAAQADLVVAYVPTASMGTAIEMWQAFRAGIPLVTISPMAANWVVRFLSGALLPDLDAFRRWVEEGRLEEMMSPAP